MIEIQLRLPVIKSIDKLFFKLSNQTESRVVLELVTKKRYCHSVSNRAESRLILKKGSHRFLL